MTPALKATQAAPLALVLQGLRWVAVIVSIPVSWVLGLLINTWLYRYAARLWCDGQIVSGFCTGRSFSDIAQLTTIVSSLAAAVLTVSVVYLLSPDSRVSVMWCSFGIGAFLALLLFGPLHSLPAVLSAGLVGAALTRRAGSADSP